jgi:hypothetical protein
VDALVLADETPVGWIIVIVLGVIIGAVIVHRLTEALAHALELRVKRSRRSGRRNDE